MPNFRIAITYRLQAQGWSEVYYIVSSDGPPIIANLSPILLSRLQFFRATGTVLQSVKVTEVGGTRNSFLNPVNTSGSVPNALAPDVTGLAARCRITFANGKQRQVWFRGLEDDATQRNIATGSTVTGGVLGTELTNAFNSMRAFGFCGQTLKPTSTGGLFDWQTIVSFGPYGPNPQWMRVNLPVTAPTPAIRDTVYFRGVNKPQFPAVRGQFRVMDHGTDGGPPATPWFAIATPWRGGNAAIGVGNCQWREVGYDYPAFSTFQFIELVTRKTGKPISSARGRASGVRLRHATLAAQ